MNELVAERGIDKKAFAAKVGFPLQMFYDWEKKDSAPLATTAYKIAKELGVSVEYLLTGVEGEVPKTVVDDLKGRLKSIKDFVKNA